MIADDRRRLHGLGLLVLAAVAFSLQSVLARVAYDWGTTPMTVTAARTWLACLVFCVVLGPRGLWPRVPRPAAALFVVTAIFYALHNPATLISFSYIPVGLSILILYLFPIFVALIGAALARAMPRRLDISAAILGFSGVALVLDVGQVALDWRGLALAGIAAIGLACNVVGAARLGRHMPAMTVPFALSIVGIVVFSAVAVVQGGPHWPRSPAGWLWFAGATTVAPVALFAFYSALPRVGPSQAALTMNLEPIATVFLALFLLGEALGTLQWLGASVILATLVGHTLLDRGTKALPSQ